MDSLVVENLGKCYLLSRDRETRQSTAFRERLGDSKDGDSDGSNEREFWALRDVSFRLQPGTILGIIGANGAGKTTLLKILARVIMPTGGRLVGVGRVVSLLELGAGFDPDLPATDNILMNAAMLGIPKHEALRRMPDIFEFAGVERFEHTVVKHYSSGMYLRLAFAVAISMNPQILLAEVIAIRLVSSAGRDIGGAPISEDVYVRTRINVLKPQVRLRCALDVTTRGQLLFRSSNPEVHALGPAGVYDIIAKIPANLLAEATYSVTVSCVLTRRDETQEYPLVVYNALTFIAFSTDDTR